MGLLDHIPAETRAALFETTLIAYLGGEEVAAMVTDYHVEHMTYREIAEKYDIEYWNAYRRIVAARIKLRRLALLPARWEDEQVERLASAARRRARKQLERPPHAAAGMAARPSADSAP